MRLQAGKQSLLKTTSTTTVSDVSPEQSGYACFSAISPITGSSTFLP